MRRLRSTDGTAQHKRAASYHLGKLTQGGATLHQQLHAEMKLLFDALKQKERAVDDAQDAAMGTLAIRDSAEITLENAIRDIDADLAKLDRAEPGRNAQKLVFPNGYGPEIDPEGASQLENLPKLRQRISSVGPHAVVAEALAKFDAAVAAFDSAVNVDNAADALVEKLFQEETEARRAIREQIEAAYGKLRTFYKSDPRRVEDFFLREGSRRKPE